MSSNFSNACKIIENIKPLGPNTKFFSKWKKAVTQVVSTFNLDENEQKLAILKAVVPQYFEYCMNAISNYSGKPLNDFLEHIKVHYGFDTLSDQCLNDLESIKIGKSTINEYNQEFRDLLEEINEESKPSEQRLLYCYIKGLEGKKMHEYLILKKPKKLDDAMQYAEETSKDFSKYDAQELIVKENASSSKSQDRNKSSKSYRNNSSFSRNYQNKQNSNSRSQQTSNQNFYYNQNYKNNNVQKQNQKPEANNQNETQLSDIDRLTQEFASLKLHFCQILDKLNNEHLK